MSHKRTKKLRKLMRKEYDKNIREIAEANGQFIKPKPKWVPMFVWINLLKIFVKIK